MRLKSPRFWIGSAAALVVLGVAVMDFGRNSPGPLSAVHAREDALSGSQSCSACHGGWFGSMTEACLECHEEIGGQIDEGLGLHGAVAGDLARRCAVCHSEHHGPDFPMVNRQSFFHAGVENPEEFDHRLVGFAMEGKHLEQDCSKCHKNARDAVLAEGARRYLGLDRNCATCHEDPHEGKMVVGCAKCHGQEAFDRHRSVGHEEHLPLIGGHADVACRDCHGEGRPHSLERLGGGRAPAPRTCADCHESPHRSAFVEGAAALESHSLGASCAACHASGHTSFREPGLTVTPPQHESSGFPLGAPHDAVACEQCHPRGPQAFSERYPGREPDACSVCHVDPHAGQFEQRCIDCHDRERFLPPAYTSEQHARTALPLTGRHREADCHACHKVPAPGGARTFRDTPSDCESCHPDAHRGFFDGRADDCALCHDTVAFSAHAAGGFEHERWTGFEVAGAHAQAECESCHPRSAEADPFGRTFGRVEEHFGAYEGCATCHHDPHRGQFDRSRLPREVAGRTGCARCHVAASFRTFPDGFDHGRWTGFPLDGAHGTVGCTPCHAPLPKPDATGRTWQRARGPNCSDCHADPHAGQFRRNGRTSCQSCHRSAMSFSDLTFRHDLDSRFRLGEAHEGVACSACHDTVRRNGAAVVRYRPLGAECTDCHTAQKNPLGRRKGGAR